MITFSCVICSCRRWL